MDPSDDVLWQIAHRECQRMARKAIRSLQRMTDSLPSGDDSGLRNVWDEICVQVQTQQSGMWDAYLDTAQGVIVATLSCLPIEEKRAIWLQTNEGMDWSPPSEGKTDIPYSDDDIAAHILGEYVLSSAADWSNARIEKYKERSIEFD